MAALAAFFESSIPVLPTLDTLAPNALRHEHTAALPLYWYRLRSPRVRRNLRHDHAAPLAAPSEVSLPDDSPLYSTPETLARHEHTAALPLYVGTDRVSTVHSKEGSPAQERIAASGAR
jgi:hypothetical protein